MDKWVNGLIVLTGLIIILVINYTVGDAPSTSAQIYMEELRAVNNYEEFQELLTNDARENYTRDDFLEIKPYLQAQHLRMNQPAIIEFEGGDVILLETSYNVNGDEPASDKQLRISNIELLPENIATYFRYYPLEIKRKAKMPENIKDNNKKFIGCKGAFVSHGTKQQKSDWYDQLRSVFGKKETWDKIWLELGIQKTGDPVIAYGNNSDGYLEITFKKEWKIDEKLLDKIYKAFHDKASEHEIKDLPVVFMQRTS